MMLRFTQRSRGLRILVVDSHPRVRQLIVLILEQADHLVDDVASATEALAHLQQVTYDIVLSDHPLCEPMSGLELATEVHTRWPDIGVILATGFDSRLTPEQATAAGADAVITKPFSGAELRKTVWQVAGSSSRLRRYGIAQ